MKKLMFSVFLAIVPTLSHADTVSNATNLLAQWQPQQVSLTKDGALRVVLDQNRISDTIFYSVIQGFCMAPLFKTSVNGVNSVFVLNRLETQGWLFESGVEACTEINQTPVDRVKMLIAATSSTHTDTANGL